VDASVHSDVSERAAQKPQLKPSKSPGTYSRWAFQSANQPPATWFWPTQATAPADDKISVTLNPPFHPGMQKPTSTVRPDRATDSEITPITDGHSGKLDRQSAFVGGMSVDHPHGGSTGSRLSKTVVPPLSPRPQADGFSTRFRGKQSGLTKISSFPSSFPKTTFSLSRDRAKAKQHKPHQQKSTSSVGWHDRWSLQRPRKTSEFSAPTRSE